MWFLPCVDPHVNLQIVSSRKCFVTFIAGMWFLPCMEHHMALQLARYRKCFVTFIAGMWFLPCVDLHVTLQTARLRKIVVTLIAGILFPLHGLSLCVSLDCHIQKMCCNIPYRNVIYLLCGSSYVSSGWYIVRTFGHIPCMDVVSLQYARYCGVLALTKKQIYSYTYHTKCSQVLENTFHVTFHETWHDITRHNEYMCNFSEHGLNKYNKLTLLFKLHNPQETLRDCQRVKHECSPGAILRGFPGWTKSQLWHGKHQSYK